VTGGVCNAESDLTQTSVQCIMRTLCSVTAIKIEHLCQCNVPLTQESRHKLCVSFSSLYTNLKLVSGLHFFPVLIDPFIIYLTTLSVN